MNMFVHVATADELEEHVPAWNDLGNNAIESNPFYEPWMLRPAAELLGTKDRLRFAFVYGYSGQHKEKGLLCGFFPLEQRMYYRLLPLRYFRLWQHEYCFLGTPLLRSGYALPALNAFFEWAASDQNHRGLIELGLVPADGSFSDPLRASVQKGGWPTFHSGGYSRPFLSKPDNPDEYLRDAVSAKTLKTLRRNSRKLSDSGGMNCVSLEAQSEVGKWTREFLDLEGSGWKGRAGTAMACRRNDRSFFERIVEQGFSSNQLRMDALLHGEHKVAMRCCLRSGRGLFAFKIAFDENYSSYSPGMLLEVEYMRRLSEDPNIDWVDSCAAPDHPMYGRLWKGRRSLETVATATKGFVSRGALSVMPAARSCYLSLRRIWALRTSKASERNVTAFTPRVSS